jgi:hypothetical protein
MFMFDLNTQIITAEKQQAELDHKIAALDTEIMRFEESSDVGDGRSYREYVKLVGDLHRAMGDLLYRLGQVDARLDDARFRAGIVKSEARILPFARSQSTASN